MKYCSVATLFMLALTFVGCSQLPHKESIHPQAPFVLKEVWPGDCEKFAADNYVIISDSSGSMGHYDKFPIQKNLVQSFISTLPDDNFNAGLYLFGNANNWEIYPIQPFDRSRFHEAAETMPFKGGPTPMHEAFLTLDENLTDPIEKTVVILFTDGEATVPSKTINAVTNLIRNHPELEIHAVQVGYSEEGAALLRELVKMTDTGSIRRETLINTPESLHVFAREVLLQDIENCGEDEAKSGRIDSDGDGVYDENDECPNTPEGATVDERGCWTLGSVLFDTDKATLRAEAQSVLDEVATVMMNNSGLDFRIEGHTDSSASEAYNQALSERRAQSVKNYLIRSGIEANRLETEGFGETQPVAPNNSPENMQLNRRVEITPL